MTNAQWLTIGFLAGFAAWPALHWIVRRVIEYHEHRMNAGANNCEIVILGRDGPKPV